MCEMKYVMPRENFHRTCHEQHRFIHLSAGAQSTSLVALQRGRWTAFVRSSLRYAVDSMHLEGEAKWQCAVKRQP